MNTYIFGTYEIVKFEATSIDKAIEIFATTITDPEIYIGRDYSAEYMNYCKKKKIPLGFNEDGSRDLSVMTKEKSLMPDYQVIQVRDTDKNLLKEISIFELERFDKFNESYNIFSTQAVETSLKEYGIELKDRLKIFNNKDISKLSKDITTKSIELEKKVKELEKQKTLINNEILKRKERLKLRNIAESASNQYFVVNSGNNASDNEKIHIFNNLKYMNEEIFLYNNCEDILNYTNIEEFDKWLRINYKEFLPFPKSIQLVKVRRFHSNQYKKWLESEASLFCELDVNDDTIFILVRNGDNVYRIRIDGIDFGKNLFPNDNMYNNIFINNLKDFAGINKLIPHKYEKVENKMDINFVVNIFDDNVINEIMNNLSDNNMYHEKSQFYLLDNYEANIISIDNEYMEFELIYEYNKNNKIKFKKRLPNILSEQKIFKNASEKIDTEIMYRKNFILKTKQNDIDWLRIDSNEWQDALDDIYVRAFIPEFKRFHALKGLDSYIKLNRDDFDDELKYYIELLKTQLYRYIYINVITTSSFEKFKQIQETEKFCINKLNINYSEYTMLCDKHIPTVGIKSGRPIIIEYCKYFNDINILFDYVIKDITNKTKNELDKIQYQYLKRLSVLQGVIVNSGIFKNVPVELNILRKDALFNQFITIVGNDMIDENNQSRIDNFFKYLEQEKRRLSPGDKVFIINTKYNSWELYKDIKIVKRLNFKKRYIYLSNNLNSRARKYSFDDIIPQKLDVNLIKEICKYTDFRKTYFYDWYSLLLNYLK